MLSEPDEELTTDDGHSPKWLRGTEGNFETLDPAFRKVKDHWNFYVPGRVSSGQLHYLHWLTIKVFATLWWEPMGEQDPEQGPHLGPSVVRYGERAYAKVRRFIVVHAKPKDYYSKCMLVTHYLVDNSLPRTYLIEVKSPPMEAGGQPKKASIKRNTALFTPVIPPQRSLKAKRSFGKIRFRSDPWTHRRSLILFRERTLPKLIPLK